MHVREKLWPKQASDWAATLFLLGAIPITFWFEVWVVLPSIHEPGSFFYLFHTGAALYLMFNIVANFMAIYLTDTSIKHEILKPPSGPYLPHSPDWHLCSICEAVVPPRAWHCEVCKTCILKRDHHCVFVSTCIGFKNHRFFIVMLAMLFLATFYASIYNSVFIWKVRAEDFCNWVTLAKILFPLCIFMLERSLNNLYLVIYLINLVGSLFVGCLLAYHMNLVLKGAVVHERKAGVRYNRGRIENLRLVLGENWKMCWLSPFVKSELPHNGIDWVPNETEKDR